MSYNIVFNILIFPFLPLLVFFFSFPCWDQSTPEGQANDNAEMALPFYS